MPKKINFSLIILFEIIFLFLILIIVPTVFLNEKPGIKQISFEKIMPLDTNHSYSQSFITDRNNLNSVSVLLKNPSLMSNDIIYFEVQNNKQETLRELSISGQGIGDPSWLNFKFAPIESKKGDVFLIKLSSNSQRDNLLYIYGDPNTQNINFKTTFVSESFIESYKENFNEQINKFKSRNTFQGLFYLSIFIVVNIFIFKRA